MDEQQQIFTKPALDKFRQWHFWWLVVFSFLLIVVFVYYLPTRFLQQVGAPHGHGEEMMEDEHMPARRSLGEGGMEDDEMMMDSHEAVYFDEGIVKNGLAVNLNISPVPYNIGAPLSMDFFVNQKPGNLPAGQAGIPVLANKLQVEHEKLMHVIGVRFDMNEFFHVHPDFLADNPAIFSIDHTFNRPGLYKIWSEIKKDGVNYSFGHPEVNVSGSGSKEDKQVSFSRNVIVGNYQVSMETSDIAVKSREVDLSFDIHNLTGMEIEVEQYLSADMHLSIIRDDLKQFIHTHPVQSHAHTKGVSPKDRYAATLYGTSPEGIIPVALANGDDHANNGGDEVINFKVAFPEAGLYKAFAQFRPKSIDLPADQALLAEFWIQVEEKAVSPISQWWMLLIISAILIAGLSWWVNNYLKVKPEDVIVKK